MKHEPDFEALFRSPVLDDEWRSVESRLSTVFRVQDGTTGSVNPGDRRAIYYLTRYLRPSSVLEIGTHVGGSTLHFAAALGDAAHLTTVDVEDVNAPEGPWRCAGMDRSPRQLLQALGFSVEFVVSDSVAYLRDVSASFDLIFLDGDHEAEKVREEILASLRVLRAGGIILLHDYFPGGESCWRGSGPIPGPYEAVRQLQLDGSALRAVPFGELPWPTKLGSNVTSLAALLT